MICSLTIASSAPRTITPRKGAPPLIVTHGFARHDGTKLREYAIWQAMKNRCLNPLAKMYPYYGGRGIGVFGPWQTDFVAFLEYIGRRPSDAHTLERTDNNKSYEPGNVRWATRGEQVRNRRNNFLITLNGVTKCATDWANERGISVGTIWRRRKLGATAPDVLLAVDFGNIHCRLCGAEIKKNATNKTICNARECVLRRNGEYRERRRARR
jgi:hypothetical protein